MHYYTKAWSLLVCFAAVWTISTAQQPPASVSPAGVALIVTTVPPSAGTATAGTTTNGTRGGCGGKGKNKGRKTRDALAAMNLHDDEPQPRNTVQDDSQKITGEHAYAYLPHAHLSLSKRSPKKSEDSSSSSEEAKDNSNTKPAATNSSRSSPSAA